MEVYMHQANFHHALLNTAVLLLFKCENKGKKAVCNLHYCYSENGKKEGSCTVFSDINFTDFCPSLQPKNWCKH